MRDVDSLEVFILDELADTHHEVPHEIDGGNVHWRQVGVAVGHEELVHLVFALELGSKLFGSDILWTALLDLIVLALHL